MGGTIWNRAKNGKIYAEWLTLAAVRDERGAISHYVATYSAITKNREAEAEIHRLAYYDPLTQLPNRRLFYNRLNQSLTNCAENGLYGAVLFLDVDHFKLLNDVHGHEVGDLLLKQLSRRLESEMGKECAIARLSGDEFVIVLDDLNADLKTATQDARDVATSISTQLSRPYSLQEAELNCTISIGIALFHGPNNEATDLLKRADLALYQAKNAGRNRVHFFDAEMQDTVDKRASLLNELQQAVALNQMRLYYQIQVDHLYRATSVEALVRWSHPELGLLEPEMFIPLAEETGLILTIGNWVLTSAYEQIRRWSDKWGDIPFKLCVNVSARQFRQRGFINAVRKALERSGANPINLGLELTESVVISDLPDTVAKMHELKKLGIRLSMDDFGTGYSSLSTLSCLPLDQLKIDQSFIQRLDLSADPNNASITQSIITLGRSLGLQVIAEGVETYNQLDFLEQNGCSAYQGYLFGRPVTGDNLERHFSVEPQRQSVLQNHQVMVDPHINV